MTINNNFDSTNFSKNSEKNKTIYTNDNEIDYPIKNIPPHKLPIEDIIINIRNLFFEILDIIENRENPIPYIYSSDKRQFSFSLFLIIFGGLLLLLSTLMVSN